MRYQKSSKAQNSSKKQARCTFDSYMVAQLVYFDTSLDWFCRSFKHISEVPRREFRKMVRCFSARWSFATMTFAMSECESRDFLCLICGIPETSIAVSNFIHFSTFSTATEQLQSSGTKVCFRHGSHGSQFCCFPVSIDAFPCQERETLNYKKAGHCSMLVGPDKHSCDLVS